jgi:TonB family protein
MIAAGLLALLLVAAPAELPQLGTAGASTPPESVVGGGFAALELTVEAGRVVATRPLQGGAPWLELLEGDVAGWVFEPADAAGRVLAAGLYRPPQLYLDVGPSAGPEPFGAVQDLPFPVRLRQPAYPPDAIGSAAVVIEVLVTEDGAVAQKRIVGPATRFDEAALSAAGEWRFRPARRGDRAVSARACLVFAFRGPVVPPPRP